MGVAGVAALAAASHHWRKREPGGAERTEEPDVHRTTLPNGLRAIVRERPGQRGRRDQRRHPGRLARRAGRDRRRGALHGAHVLPGHAAPARPRRTSSARSRRAAAGRTPGPVGSRSTSRWSPPVDSLDLALDVIADQLVNSLFAAEKIDKERRVVLEELNGRLNSPSTQGVRPVPARRVRRPSGPQPADRQSRDDRQRRRARCWWPSATPTSWPSNMVVAVVGDVRHEDVFPKLATAFEGMRTGSAPAPIAAAVPPPVARARTSTSPGQQARVVLGGPTVGLDTRRPLRPRGDRRDARRGRAGAWGARWSTSRRWPRRSYPFYLRADRRRRLGGQHRACATADVDAVIAAVKEELHALRETAGHAGRPGGSQGVPARAAACSIASAASTWPNELAKARRSAPTRADGRVPEPHRCRRPPRTSSASPARTWTRSRRRWSSSAPRRPAVCRAPPKGLLYTSAAPGLLDAGA